MTASFQRGETVHYTARVTGANLRYMGAGVVPATVVRVNPNGSVVIDIPFDWAPFAGDPDSPMATYRERGTVRRTVSPSSLERP
jgi:hypothetical protein